MMVKLHEDEVVFGVPLALHEFVADLFYLSLLRRDESCLLLANVLCRYVELPDSPCRLLFRHVVNLAPETVLPCWADYIPQLIDGILADLFQADNKVV
jgi:hypothetical protein